MGLFKAFLVDYKPEYVMLPIESNRSIFPILKRTLRVLRNFQITQD